MTVCQVNIASGARGVWQTLGTMRRYVDAGKKNAVIIKAARGAVYMTPEKSSLHEVTTLFDLVRDGIRYVGDVYDVETLSEATKTLLSRQGDCDDQVILLCSLFESIGYATRFVVAGYNDSNTYEHVYCQVLADGEWIDCDPTENESFGWAPPDPVAYAIERV